MPRLGSGSIDPGWEHAVPQDDKKKKVKCNYCSKVVSGGIHRLKKHLARVPGEVVECTMAPEHVYLQMKKHLEGYEASKRLRQSTDEEISSFGLRNSQLGDGDHGELASQKRREKDVIDGTLSAKKIKGIEGQGSNSKLKEKKALMEYLVVENPKPILYKPLRLKGSFDKEASRKVCSAICRFFYHASIPFNAIKSPYFKNMVDMISQYGEGLKIPSIKAMSCQFLQEEVVNIREYLKDFKASWASTGCTIMADSWTNGRGRTLINFFVYCPRGLYFVKSVDASEIVKDVKNLFELLDEVVEEVGEENVVQVVTDNADNYVSAGKLLEAKRKHLFWTPCTAHCLDLMLEDIGKMKKVAECIDKGKKVTQFIYNRIWLLNLMRKEFTGGKGFLRLPTTRFSTNFLTLQSLLDQKVSIRRMFLSEKWMSSPFAKMDEGKEVEKIVLNATFWKMVKSIQKSVEPIMKVLRMVDRDDKPTMPYIYNAIDEAKLAIKVANGEDERKYGAYWSVVDRRWESHLRHPLHAAAYFLNPRFRYHPHALDHPEIQLGLNECIVRFESDAKKQVEACVQISPFVSGIGDFGSELAVNTRYYVEPACWWQQHGMRFRSIQRIAIRILSQTCTSSGCERNWSIFDQIHAQRHNRLAQKRLNDFVYVHYNLRLRERQLRRKPDSYDPICLDNILLQDPLDDWVIETKRPVLEDDFLSEIEEVEGRAYAEEVEEKDSEDSVDEERESSGISGGTPVVVGGHISTTNSAIVAMDDDDDVDDDDSGNDDYDLFS